MKICYIDPVGDSSWVENIRAYLSRYAAPGTEVAVRALRRGLPEHLTYCAYEAMIGPDLLHAVKQAEQEGFDGCIIGCFYDPFLTAAREVCSRMVVTAPAEAALHLGATLGDTFSTIVVGRKSVPEMRSYARALGFGERQASFRALDIDVLELQEDPGRTEARLRGEIAKAIAEDGAESILLGCTMQLGFFEQAQEEFGVPVIDAMVAPLKYAEFLCECRRAAGWYFSKIGRYAAPDADELARWGTETLRGSHDQEGA